MDYNEILSKMLKESIGISASELEELNLTDVCAVKAVVPKTIKEAYEEGFKAQGDDINITFEEYLGILLSNMLLTAAYERKLLKAINK